MTSSKFISSIPDDLNQIGKEILNHHTESKIFIFVGNLGAGKTTLIKFMCGILGYEGEVTSPTFSLINHYATNEVDIYHMDLYRLKDMDELLDIGIEEYLYSDNYCFIEWPQLLTPLLEDVYYLINIEVGEDQIRKIDIKKC